MINNLCYVVSMYLAKSTCSNEQQTCVIEWAEGCVECEDEVCFGLDSPAWG